MRRAILAGAAALGLLASSSAAHAGIYSDDLSRCLVKAATPNDTTTLMRWMFVIMSSDPHVRPLSAATPAQREEFQKDTALLIQRLLLVDCRKEAVDAVKYDGTSAIETSFDQLGRVAVGGLLSSPDAQAGIGDFHRYIDKDKWAAFAKEAGRSGELNTGK